MNATNSLIHALAARGGFATEAELKQVLPKVDILATSVELVEWGLAVWDEGRDGSQELRLKEETLETMACNALKMTQAELHDALGNGQDFTGYTIFVKRDRGGERDARMPNQ